MRFSGKMRLTIILIVTKNQGLTLTLEDAFFEKSQGEGWVGGGGVDKPTLLKISLVFVRFELKHSSLNGVPFKKVQVFHLNDVH